MTTKYLPVVISLLRNFQDFEMPILRFLAHCMGPRPRRRPIRTSQARGLDRQQGQVDGLFEIFLL